VTKVVKSCTTVCVILATVTLHLMATLILSILSSLPQPKNYFTYPYLRKQKLPNTGEVMASSLSPVIVP